MKTLNMSIDMSILNLIGHNSTEQRRLGTWMYCCLFDVVVFVSFCFCLYVCSFVCLFFGGVVPCCEFQNTAVLVQSKI